MAQAIEKIPSSFSLCVSLFLFLHFHSLFHKRFRSLRLTSAVSNWNEKRRSLHANVAGRHIPVDKPILTCWSFFVCTKQPINDTRHQHTYSIAAKESKGELNSVFCMDSTTGLKYIAIRSCKWIRYEHLATHAHSHIRATDSLEKKSLGSLWNYRAQIYA